MAKKVGVGAGQVGVFKGLKIWSLSLYLFFYLPILVLFIYSFNEGKRVMVWTGFAPTKWYVKMFNNEAILDAALTSLLLAVIVTVISTAIAIAAALALARGAYFKGSTATYGLIMMPLVVPEIVTAVASLIFLNYGLGLIGIHLGFGSLIIAHTVFCIPFAFLPIRARLQDMDTSLEQAAVDLYATEWQAFRYVTLPLMVPGIIAGATLAFVISLDDFIISNMVSTPGSTTLPVYIYSMMRQAISPEVNAVSIMLFSFSVILVTFYWLLTKPKN
jgi:spermidine/putrescine transport system permease protein